MSQWAICHSELYVTVSYMSQWAICHSELYVTVSYMSQWVICHSELYVTVRYNVTLNCQNVVHWLSAIIWNDKKHTFWTGRIKQVKWNCTWTDYISIGLCGQGHEGQVNAIRCPGAVTATASICGAVNVYRPICSVLLPEKHEYISWRQE